MRSQYLWLLGAIVGVIVLNAAVIAQTSAKPGSGAPASGGKARGGDVRISNRGKTTYNKGQGLARMMGDVRVTQDREDFILYSDELLYNENTNQAVARGSLRVESRDSTITGTEIRANFDTKIITITGNVVMKSHGAEDGIKGSDPNKERRASRSLRDEVRSKASRLTCNRIDYHYENREAVATGNIRMAQDKNSGTCERILFDEENNIAQLTGQVKFTDGEGRTINAKQVIVYIDSDQVETQEPTRMQIPNRPKGNTVSQPKTKFPEPTELPADLFPAEPPPAPTVARPNNTGEADEANNAEPPAGDGEVAEENPNTAEKVQDTPASKDGAPAPEVKTATRD